MGEAAASRTRGNVTLRRLALAALACLAAACASAGAYHARSVDAPDGYAERRLGDAGWRVEYVGDASTSQERVETYLLYRAAELTMASGFDWFMPAERVAEEETEIVVEARPAPAPSPVWRPLWRHRSRFFWSDWMPVGPRPAQSSEQAPPSSRTITRYAAREDITMGRGVPPAGAFNAREVLALLEPAIARE